MNNKSVSLKLILNACWHIATLASTTALTIVAPAACIFLAVIYKWQDKTQDATYYLALLAVLLLVKDHLMDAYERSYNKYMELYHYEYPEEKK